MVMFLHKNEKFLFPSSHRSGPIVHCLRWGLLNPDMVHIDIGQTIKCYNTANKSSKDGVNQLICYSLNWSVSRHWSWTPPTSVNRLWQCFAFDFDIERNAARCTAPVAEKMFSRSRWSFSKQLVRQLMTRWVMDIWCYHFCRPRIYVTSSLNVIVSD